MPPPDDEVVSGVTSTDGEGSVSDRTSSKPVRRFTWKELSHLNRPENAHVAVRGKVTFNASGSCPQNNVEMMIDLLDAIYGGSTCTRTFLQGWLLRHITFNW